MPTNPIINPGEADAEVDSQQACIICFNANDPSGAGGLAADVTTVASVGAHALPVMSGAYSRDTGEIFDHFELSDEAVTEQARAILEDIPVQVFKVGFVGSPENLSAIAEISADYPNIPLVAYMPNLSWWEDVKIDSYQDAFRELLLPQTTVLTGNHSTLWRWLLPDWESDRPPGARDIARAANEYGVAYTLVTGIPMPDQQIDNVLASPESVIESRHFERFEATFSGSGDTLAAALAALLATGEDLGAATLEALGYLDRCLSAGFRPGMGQVVPDRLFWAQPEAEEAEDTATKAEVMEPTDPSFNSTRH
ncbi:MAG: bifunctional hydroxymethylpyrimidine kinase/phosphomethylpyrimidine kinase [Burkholderiaceae bacterium]|jgi:hydroxymethylpyrimidine/phosphomethylpyrimidine kinase|nr:bifunctional hydroxymethylpyrimidine kinase/phosphomethylpyrimidine kinase [Betaproteobacteria bacterium]MBP6645983.1 bifunctional hydroxymethylpyrimidine kinase/phosphomethylpyrimidine kinase [Burkholderiaceae bacterium]